MLNVRERRAACAKVELADLVDEIGRGRAIVLLDVHESTLERWLDGRTRIPAAVLIALRAARGQLPGQEHRAWVGWRFAPDGLLYHGRATYAPSDILAMHWKDQQVRALERRVEELKGLVARLAAPSAGHGAANDAADLTNAAG